MRSGQLSLKREFTWNTDTEENHDVLFSFYCNNFLPVWPWKITCNFISKIKTHT